MFGIGGTEILVLAAVALVVVGPKRLPEIMRLFGKGLGEFKRMANDVRTTVTAEMDRIDLEEKTKKAHEELFGDKKAEQPSGEAKAPEAQPAGAKAEAGTQPGEAQADASAQAAGAATAQAATAPEPEHAGVDEWSVEQAEMKAAAASGAQGVEQASVRTPDEVKAELDAAREACRKAEAEGAGGKAEAGDSTLAAGESPAKTAATPDDKAASPGREPGKPA